MESNILIEQSLGQVTKLIACSYIVNIQLTIKLVITKILGIMDKKRIAGQNNKRKKAK